MRYLLLQVSLFLHRFSLKTLVGLLFAALAFLVQFFLGVDIHADCSTLTAAVVNFANAAAFLVAAGVALWGHIEKQLANERTLSALTQATPVAPRIVAASALPLGVPLEKVDAITKRDNAAVFQGRQVLPTFAVIALTLGCLELSGCATTGSGASGDVATDVATDLGQGLIVAQDVYTAADAVEANNTGGKLNVAQVLSDAQAASTSANSTGLATAVNVLVSDVNSQIDAGASPSDAIAAVASTTATAQVTAATTPVPTAAPSTSYATPRPSPPSDVVEITASF